MHNNPLPDFLEIDLEAHSQAVVVGSRHRICLFTFFYLKRSGLRALPSSKFMWLGFQPPCSEPNGIRWQAQEVIGDIIWLEASWDLQAHPLKCLLSVFDQLRLMRGEREPLINTAKGPEIVLRLRELRSWKLITDQQLFNDVQYSIFFHAYLWNCFIRISWSELLARLTNLAKLIRCALLIITSWLFCAGLCSIMLCVCLEKVGSAVAVPCVLDGSLHFVMLCCAVFNQPIEIR